MVSLSLLYPIFQVLLLYQFFQGIHQPPIQPVYKFSVDLRSCRIVICFSMHSPSSFLNRFCFLSLLSQLEQLYGIQLRKSTNVHYDLRDKYLLEKLRLEGKFRLIFSDRNPILIE